ncbi:RNA polymerase sigma factor [Calditrichota bacterium]
MLKINFFQDRQLIERIKAADRSVLGEIYLKYEKQICTYIQSHGGDEFDAQDILQETIIVLWQKVNSGRFDLSSKLNTFLIAVTKNKWRTELRRRGKFPKDSLPEDKNNEYLDQLENIISNENREIINQAISKIKPICKQLLLLFYFEERSLEEITGILKFSNVNVTKSKKYQCKKSLQEILLKQLAESERRI